MPPLKIQSGMLHIIGLQILHNIAGNIRSLVTHNILVDEKSEMSNSERTLRTLN